jgi:hypothetical protein
MKRILSFLLLFVAINLSAQTVYVTKTGEKYHVGTCRYLAKSKIAIELNDAINRGYGACKICQPPQSVSKRSEEVKEEKTTDYNKNATSSQCTATTKKGSRCKRMTTSVNGKCWQHGGD